MGGKPEGKPCRPRKLWGPARSPRFIICVCLLPAALLPCRPRKLWGPARSPRFIICVCLLPAALLPCCPADA